jgi:hypothetical protein
MCSCQQKLIFFLMSAQWWNDYNLVWNPYAYGGIESIQVPSTKIWLPDFALENKYSSRKICLPNENVFLQSAGEKYDNLINVYATIQHTGEMIYVTPRIFKSTCPFNGTLFPFVSICYSQNHLITISFYREILYFIGHTKLYVEICGVVS